MAFIVMAICCVLIRPNGALAGRFSVDTFVIFPPLISDGVIMGLGDNLGACLLVGCDSIIEACISEAEVGITEAEPALVRVVGSDADSAVGFVNLLLGFFFSPSSFFNLFPSLFFLLSSCFLSPARLFISFPELLFKLSDSSLGCFLIPFDLFHLSSACFVRFRVSSRSDVFVSSGNERLIVVDNCCGSLGVGLHALVVEHVGHLLLLE